MIDTASKNAVPLPLRELGDELSNRRERRQGIDIYGPLHPLVQRKRGPDAP